MPPDRRRFTSAGDLLDHLGLGEYKDVFDREDLDLDVLAQVSEEQLRGVGVRTLGQRIRIQNSARQHANQNTESTENEPTNQVIEEEAPETAAPATPEETLEASEHQEQNENEVTEHTREETRGSEDPEYFREALTTGRISCRFYVGFDRFDRKNWFNSGLSYFHCNVKGCQSKLSARYDNVQNRDYETPTVEKGPTEHKDKDGTIHEPDKGKRLKEVALNKIKDAIKADPLRGVKDVHEDVYNQMLDSLPDEFERLEFIQR